MKVNNCCKLADGEQNTTNLPLNGKSERCNACCTLVLLAEDHVIIGSETDGV
jgi:hypothetical protein